MKKLIMFPISLALIFLLSILSGCPNRNPFEDNQLRLSNQVCVGNEGIFSCDRGDANSYIQDIDNLDPPLTIEELEDLLRKLGRGISSQDPEGIENIIREANTKQDPEQFLKQFINSFIFQWVSQPDICDTKKHVGCKEEVEILNPPITLCEPYPYTGSQGQENPLNCENKKYCSTDGKEWCCPPTGKPGYDKCGFDTGIHRNPDQTEPYTCLRISGGLILDWEPADESERK